MSNSNNLVDRLKFAASFSSGKKVLDIGGHKYVDVSHTSIHKIAMNVAGGSVPPFIRAYRRIQENAKEYRIVDVQSTGATDYVLDLNDRDSIVRRLFYAWRRSSTSIITAKS